MPELRINWQIFDHYLKDICNITSNYDIFTIEIVWPKPNHTTHQIQTDGIDIEFSKVFTDYISNIQHKNSQQNHKSSTPKHQRQINQVQSTEENQSDPPGIDNTENSELQLSHINCDSKDDESETVITLSINMLQTENENETPIESHFYQNTKNFNNFEKSEKTQNITGYTEQENQVQTKYTRIPQIKYKHQKEKFGQYHFS